MYTLGIMFASPCGQLALFVLVFVKVCFSSQGRIIVIVVINKQIFWPKRFMEIAVALKYLYGK